MDQADQTDPGWGEGHASSYPPPTPPRRLYREPEEKKLTGVCGGLADYVGIDPTIVRVAVALLTFATGGVAIAYVIAAFVVPERPASVPRVTRDIGRSETWTPGTQVLAVLLVVALVGWADLDWWFNAPTFAIGLVVLGAWLLTSDRSPTLGHRRVTHSPETEKPPPAANTWSAGSTTFSGDTYDAVDHSAPYDSIPTDDSAAGAAPQGEVPPPVPPWGVGASHPPPPLPRDRRRGGAALPLGVLAALLIAAGVLSLLAVTGADVGPTKALAAGLLIIGLGMVLGAWRGNGRPLVIFGIPLVAVLVLVDLVDVPFDAGAGDETHVVDTRAGLERHHELTAGSLTIDLRDAPLSTGTRQSPPIVEADVGVGEMIVIVPRDAHVHVVAQADIGDIVGAPDGDHDGIDIDERFTLDGDEGGGRLRLDLHVGVGEIEVRRA